MAVSPAFPQTALPCGQNVAGTIATAGQKDRYSIAIAPGDAITIRGRATAGNWTAYVELDAPDGKRVDYSYSGKIDRS